LGWVNRLAFIKNHKETARMSKRVNEIRIKALAEKENDNK
jgi:hypothetical protein